MKVIYKLLILGLIIIISLLLIWQNFVLVDVKDAYLDNQGHFNFTIENHGDKSLDLIYQWHLDDPKAKQPVYTGKGEIKVPAKGSYTINETFNPINDYDQRFFIMNVEIFRRDIRIATYTKQKSPYDWDYSTLPPYPNH